jgi:hypothetical protein
MNPFQEIEVTPLYSKDGMRSRGKSVRIRDENSEDSWNELGVVSPNYLLIHNSKVKEVVDQIASLSPIKDWNEKKLFFDGKRFVYSIVSDQITAEISVGDLVRFGLIGYNSYDGSRVLSVGMYAEHVVCSNGMTSDTYFNRFIFRHHQGNINWDEQVEQAFRSILPGARSKLFRFAKLLYQLKNKEVTTNDLKQIRADYLSNLAVNNWGKVVDRFLADEDHNAFGLLDACTRVFWHNDKQTFTDYKNNSYATDSLIHYSQLLN